MVVVIGASVVVVVVIAFVVGAPGTLVSTLVVGMLVKPILGTDPSLVACTPSVAVVVVSGVDGFFGLSVYIVVFEGSVLEHLIETSS